MTSVSLRRQVGKANGLITPNSATSIYGTEFVIAADDALVPIPPAGDPITP
jgi:hypothetical protein